MTEAEWHTSDDPFALLRDLPGVGTQRKERLLILAACERNPRPFREINAAEPLALAARLVEGTADAAERKRERQRLMAGWSEAAWPVAHYIAHQLLARRRVSAARLFWNVIELSRQVAFVTGREGRVVMVDPRGAEMAERAALAHDCRDMFGNPFRPISLEPRWQTETVVALAAGIFADRAFDRMPILADALEEVGCDNTDILAHCRGDGPHVRGCWVVDLLLGKS